MDTRDLRPLQDLIDRREDCDPMDHVQTRSDIDEETINQARAAEKKLKRLTMAKYSHELFDEII